MIAEIIRILGFLVMIKCLIIQDRNDLDTIEFWLAIGGFAIGLAVYESLSGIRGQLR